MERREKRQVRRSALSEVAFRRYFPASWFSSLGSWMLRFLLGWSAWDLTLSATWVGITAALMLAPALLLSPWFGILSDRINPRSGLVASMFIHGFIALAGVVALWAGVFGVPVLLSLALAMGVVTSGHSPMRLALIPLLVERAALPSAVGLSATTFNIARILGPALGAALIAGSGPELAFMLASIMFAIAAAILIKLHGVGVREPRPREPYVQQFKAGIRYVREEPAIQLIFAFTILNGVLGRTVVELLPAFAGGFLGGGARELATLTASAGLGSIVGGLVMTRQQADTARLLSLVAMAIAAAALLILGLFLGSNLYRLGALIFALSLVTTIAGTGCQTIIQLRLVESYRGRVLSLWTLFAMGAPAIGSACLGVLTDSFGYTVVFTITAGAGWLVLWLLYARRSSLS
ncbi:MAG: MFS transporter [Luminiphilus sp.]|nr:MFS transporter [Luminiphilus sp.]